MEQSQSIDLLKGTPVAGMDVTKVGSRMVAMETAVDVMRVRLVRVIGLEGGENETCVVRCQEKRRFSSLHLMYSAEI